MLSTYFTIGFSLLGVVLAVFALISLVRLANYVEGQVLPEVRKSDLAALSAEMSDLRDAYDSLLSSHRKLRARIGMRTHRDKNNANGEDVPDPRTDPAGYKRAMRLRHLR